MVTLSTHIKELLAKPFPQNILIRKPYTGGAIFFIVLYGFTVLYQPLNVHGSPNLSIYITILVYCVIISISEMPVALLINITNCFAPKGNWTVINELLSIVILLATIGISTYLAGFMIEPTTQRFNFYTFFDAFFRSVLVGIVPVVLPSMLNIRYAFAPETFLSYQSKTTENDENLIKIESKAKKEHLCFFPNEFIYAESEGNYVTFHLIKKDKLTQVTIRNSISDIETQLANIPTFFRSHRAFIVNLNKILSSEGNALGYRLTLANCNKMIPVSRPNARIFEKMMN